MKSFRISLASLAVLSALGISGCESTSAVPEATPAIVSGVITNFGSIFVNGVKYETGSSAVTLDDATAGESDLKLGMVVTLEATINPDGTTGVAKAVSFADEVEGMVGTVSIAPDGTGTLVVMGQTVTVDVNTAFESKVPAITTIDKIVTGNIIEISGFSSGTGSILATRVEVKKEARDSDTIGLKGVITDLTAGTFKLGALTVVYGSGTDLQHTLIDGLFVEVKSVDGINGLGQLIASKIKLKGEGKKGLKVEKDKHMELEGIVTSAATADGKSFMLNGQTIMLSTGTEYKDGGTIAGLLVGVRIKVEVTSDSLGNIVAKEIKFANEGNIRFEGTIEAIDLVNNTVTVMGQVIKLTNSTIIQDKRNKDGYEAVRKFGVKDLALGQRIKIRAYKDGGAWIATKFERKNANDNGSVSELNALVDSVGMGTEAGTIVVAGIKVSTTGLNNATFTVGNRVKLEGTYVAGIGGIGGTFTATKFEVKAHNEHSG